jgi:hypothetical protein
MGINRFTKYTAPEFIQSYDPYPVEKMMGLAQHQQKRFDQIDTAIGKAYSDAVIKPGLSVEGRRTAAIVNKERKEQIDNLVNDFYENRNVRGAVRGLSELSSNWKGDTRADFVNADRELMNPILTQTGQEGYGNYVTHKALNPTTGEYTLGYTDEQIAAGVAPTLADYGMMSNPGSSAAFKANYIDPVKAQIEQGFSRGADGSLIKTDNKSLTVRRFMDQVTPDLNNLSSDGTTLDNLSDAPIEMQKFVAWKQQEARQKGEVYNLGSLKADYMTEVQKYTMFDPNTTVTKATKADKAAIAAEEQGSGLLDQFTGVGDRNNIDLNTLFADKGLTAVAEAAGYKGRTEDFMNVVLPKTDLDAIAARDPAIKESIRKRVEATNQTGTSTTEFEVINGVKRAKKISALTPAQINKEVEDEFKRTINLLDKAYELKIKAFDRLKNEGKISSEAYIDEHGDVILSKKKQETLDKGLAEIEEEVLGEYLMVVNETTLDKEQFPAIAKALKTKPGSASVGVIGNTRTGNPISFENDVHRVQVIKELEKLKHSQTFGELFNQSNESLLSIEGIANKLGILPDTMKQLYESGQKERNNKGATMAEAFNNNLKLKQDEFLNQHDPRYEMNQALDKEIKEHYGNREYYNNELVLLDKDAVGDNKFTNEQHQLLSSVAVQKSTEAGGIYINGVPVKFDEMPDLLKDEKGILGEDRDFRNLVFNPKTVEIDYRADKNGNYKVFATGKFEKQVKVTSGEGTVPETDKTVKSYQVDITEHFMSMLGDSEKARLMYSDAIVDKSMTLVAGADRGESIFIGNKQKETAKEILGGDTYMTKNRNGTFNLEGMVPSFNPQTNELEIIDLKTSEIGSLYRNIPMSDLNQVATEIATSISYLDGKNTMFTTPQQEAAILAHPSIKNASEVDSYNMGIFQLNTKNNDTFEQQERIGFAEIGSEFIPVETMSPERQVEYASKLFVNGGGGWNQWDVTEKDIDGNFKNPNFKKAIDVLKGIEISDRNNALKIKTAINSVFKTSSVDEETINRVLSQFNVNSLRSNAQLKRNTYNTSAISRQENLNDALVALAVMAADSGFNSNAIEIVPK